MNKLFIVTLEDGTEFELLNYNKYNSDIILKNDDKGLIVNINSIKEIRIVNQD